MTTHYFKSRRHYCSRQSKLKQRNGEHQKPETTRNNGILSPTRPHYPLRQPRHQTCFQGLLHHLRPPRFRPPPVRQISKSQHNATEVDIFAGARSSGLDIRYTTFNDGFPLDFDRNFSVEYTEFLLHGYADKVDELIANILHSDSSTAASHYFLIADTICIWHEKIAKKYGLVNVSFWTEPAIVFSLYYHLELLKEKGHVPVNGRRETVDYVPGIESINTRDFMSLLHDTQTQLTQEFFFGTFDAVKSADFILCNTVQELEADTISALQQKQPFYAIGPLFPADFAKSSIAKSLLPESKTSDWLN